MAAILFLYVETVALPFLGRSRAWQLYNSDLFGSKLKKKRTLLKWKPVCMETRFWSNELHIQTNAIFHALSEYDIGTQKKVAGTTENSKKPDKIRVLPVIQCIPSVKLIGII